jgi:hypothetical protein
MKSEIVKFEGVGGTRAQLPEECCCPLILLLVFPSIVRETGSDELLGSYISDAALDMV